MSCEIVTHKMTSRSGRSSILRSGKRNKHLSHTVPSNKYRSSIAEEITQQSQQQQQHKSSYAPCNSWGIYSERTLF